MMDYEISYPHYIVIKNNEVVDFNLSDDMHYEAMQLTLKGQTQLHVVIIADQGETHLTYAIAPLAQVDLIETRMLSGESTLKRTVTIGESSIVNMFHENLSVSNESLIFDDDVKVDRYAQVQTGYAELSDHSEKVNYHYDLIGEGADVRLRMAALAKEDEAKDYVIEIKHLAPNTTGIMDNYGVVKDRGHMVIDGIGTITKGMHDSASHQTNKIIVFDKECYASANPYLFIDDYDVKASHAAGVGKMDEEHLYYLESRGLSQRQSMQLITYGYLKPVVEIIENEMLRERFEHVLAKVGGARV